jgi:hypothetical protein
VPTSGGDQPALRGKVHCTHATDACSHATDAGSHAAANTQTHAQADADQTHSEAEVGMPEEGRHLYDRLLEL